MNYKSKKSKATDIPKEVREAVYRRDNMTCIFCYGANGLPGIPNMHFIPRSRGGLGIEQNILTACQICHDTHDFHDGEGIMHEHARKYLETHYPGFKDKDRIYDKWRWTHE